MNEQKKQIVEWMKEVKFTPFANGGGLDVSVRHQLPEHAFEAIAEHLIANDVALRSDVAREIFADIYALIDNAEEKLDIIFTKADDYRRGYENSVKHFRGCMDKLSEKYIQEQDASLDAQIKNARDVSDTAPSPACKSFDNVR